MVEFRWIAAIALWTLLIGPIAGVPSGSGANQKAQAKGKASHLLAQKTGGGQR